MNKWTWIMVCTALAGFMEFIGIGIHETAMYDYENVKVEKTAPYEYWMEPAGQPRFHASVCHDYLEPGFDTGMILTRVIFVDQGECWSLDPNKHAGYFIARRKDGTPIVETAN